MDVIIPDYHEESRQNGRHRGSKNKANNFGPLPMFHDASPCQCTYDLTILDCVKGLSKANVHNFFNFMDFNIKEYEHFEQVEVCLHQSGIVMNCYYKIIYLSIAYVILCYPLRTVI